MEQEEKHDVIYISTIINTIFIIIRMI